MDENNPTETICVGMVERHLPAVMDVRLTARDRANLINAGLIKYPPTGEEAKAIKGKAIAEGMAKKKISHSMEAARDYLDLPAEQRIFGIKTALATKHGVTLQALNITIKRLANYRRFAA